jgi:hypothetical protein
MSATAERLYTTGNETNDLMTIVVRDLPCRLKRFLSTDDGKISLGIEVEVNDKKIRAQLRTLFEVQQGQIRINVAGVQGELDLDA